MSKIVDFFSFYGPYGSELLLLRYHLLKDYVDEFIISESNRSHNGDLVEFEARKKIKEWGLPAEKFKVIELHTPSNEELQIEMIDILNCYDFDDEGVQKNINSQRGRVRDRISKNALLEILDQYDDDTVFFHGDIDEIINPIYIEDAVNIARENLNGYILFPLVYLEGRADLRVYNRHTNQPEGWYAGLFCCTKSLLKTVPPINIRSNKFVPEEVYYLFLTDEETGEQLQDLGWHFSWMGGKEAKLTKRNSWCHRFDQFEWLVSGQYESDEMISLLTQEYKDGSIPPCGNIGFILRDFPKSELPKEIWELPIVEKYLFPDQEQKTFNFAISKNIRTDLIVCDNFYEDPHAVREYALTLDYHESDYHRGRRTEFQHVFPGTKEKFEELLGKKITGWTEQYGMCGRFQHCIAEDALVYHCDLQKYAAMIYLTPNAPYECGTSLWAHKETGIRHNTHSNICDCFIGGHFDKTKFYKTDDIGNVFNRLIIFNGGCIHSASEYFGQDKYDSRLFQIFFFDAE